jgi:hypothetical protein
MTGTEPSPRWSTDHLDALRLVGDPELDPLVAEWAECEQRPGEQLIAMLVNQGLAATEGCTPALADFLATAPAWPTWVDESLVRRGQQLFSRWAAPICTSLLVASLPAGYAAARGARVLCRTGSLGDDRRLFRRVLETAQWLFDVAEEGGLDVGGPGYEAARRIRLFHAVVRHAVLADGLDVRRLTGTTPWDDPDEKPINQEDLLGVLCTFAVTTLDVLDRSGIHIGDMDREGWVHLWCVAGHLQGIGRGAGEAAPDLLPLDLAEARRAWDAIRAHAYADSPEGRALTGALLRRLAAATPGDRLDGLSASAIRHYLGDDVAELLGVPPADWTRSVFVPASIAWRAASSPLVPGLLAWPIEEFLRYWITATLRPRRDGSTRATEVKVPPELVPADLVRRTLPPAAAEMVRGVVGLALSRVPGRQPSSAT